MKVIVIGGTGLLGYHAILELLANGHSVTSVSRGSIKLNGWFPEKARVLYNDVFKMSNTSLKEMFSGFDAMVYAVGPDERNIHKGSAYDYFYEKLVIKCEEICSVAKSSGITRIVILGSYFQHFDRTNPDWNLSKNHPYINCRTQQASRALALADDQLKVMIMEIPYVFGTMPNRDPLWKDQLVARIDSILPLILFTKGGTAMVTAKYCGEATRGALEQGKTGNYLIGDVNMSWNEMLGIASKALYGSRRKVVIIPNLLAQGYGLFEKLKNKIQGKEAGLNYIKFIGDVQSKFTYIPEETILQIAHELNLTRGGVRDAMKDTFRRC